MLETIRMDYIRTAKAKGLSQRVVVFKHALRNAVLPVITYLGLQFGALLGGAVVTESIFAWPGMGRYLLTGIQDRDYPVIQSSILVFSFMFVMLNLLVDLSYALVDPRISYN
jgi:peptide/nickel transport system permease protein